MGMVPTTTEADAVESGLRAGLQTRSADSRAFEEFWRRIRGGNLIPRRGDFNIARAARFVRDLVLMEAPAPDRKSMRIRLAGERYQEIAPLVGRQDRQLGLVHKLEPRHRDLACPANPDLELIRLVQGIHQHPPQRDAPLARMSACVDLRPQSRLPVRAIGMPRRRQRRRLGKRIVGGRDTQSVEVRESLEYRTHGIAGPLGDLDSGRHLGILANKRQERLDDELLGPLAAQAATVDPGRLRRRWQRHVFHRTDTWVAPDG